MSRFRVSKLRQHERDALARIVSQIVDDDLQSKSGSRRELWVNAIVGGLTAKTRLEMADDTGRLGDRDTVLLLLRVDPVTGIRFPEFGSRRSFVEFFTDHALVHRHLPVGVEAALTARQREDLLDFVWEWVKERRESQEQGNP